MTGPLSRIGPILVLLVVLVISAALGYLWAITSVQIVDTGIWQLRPEYQGVYIQAVADAYAGDNDRGAAIQRLSYLCQENGGIEAALAQAETVYNDPQRAANRDALRGVLGEVQASTEAGVCSTNAADFGVPSILPLVLLIVMALIIFGGGVVGDAVQRRELAQRRPPGNACAQPCQGWDARNLSRPVRRSAALPPGAPLSRHRQRRLTTLLKVLSRPLFSL